MNSPIDMSRCGASGLRRLMRLRNNNNMRRNYKKDHARKMMTQKEISDIRDMIIKIRRAIEGLNERVEL